MKKVLSGKRYNTETAKLIGEVWNGLPTDLDYTHETLYRTKGEAYFIHTEGGPRTIYAATSESGNSISGERIIPINPDAAKAWAEKHLTADEYERAFGDAEEPDTKISAVLTQQQFGDLISYCDSHGLKKSQVIRDAIAAYIVD